MKRLLLAFFLALPLTAQTPGLAFAKLPAGAAQPSPRFDGAIVYHPAGRRILLFGGQDSAGPRNDLWAYSLDAQSWTELNPSGTKPRARFGHTFVYDPVRGRAVVFGGQAGTFFSDVFAYNIAANAWQELAGDGAGPNSRYGHSGVYDPKQDRMIVSHGFTDTGRFDDTWAFQFGAKTWINVTPSGAKPLKRCLHHAVLDEKDNLMFLYGGCSSGFGPCPQRDLWALDLNTNRWTERISSPMPDAREHYGMAFDSKRGLLVLYGGDPGPKSDVWEYDPAANSWRTVTPGGDPVAGRNRHETAYAPDLGEIFFFGGLNPGLTNELLTLGLPPGIADAGVRNVFSGTPDNEAPGAIVSIYGQNLGPAPGVITRFDETGTLPTSAGGVSVTVNGILAPLYYARADQINAEIPYEVAGQTHADIVVSYNGRSSAPAGIPLTDTAPGLWPFIIQADNTIVLPSNPVARGGIVVLYATGQGVTSPPSVTGREPAVNMYPPPAADVRLTIGGKTAELLFIGQAPQTAGLMQINARVPLDAAPGAFVPVVLTIGGRDSQIVSNMAIR